MATSSSLTMKKSKDNSLIGEWRRYQDRMNIPIPQEDKRFSAELLLRQDMIALMDVAQFGDELSRVEAFRAIARLGDEEGLLSLILLIGRVSPQWMIDSYKLYSSDIVNRVIIHNPLNRFEARDVVDYAEGKVIHHSSIPDIVINNPSSLTIPLEDVIAACVGVRERETLEMSLVVPSESLYSLAPLYNVPDTTITALIAILTLGSPNTISNPYHFANAAWISTRAPWLIITSSREIQQALFQYFNCYRLVLLYGNEGDRSWLIGQADPIRTNLATYFPRMVEVRSPFSLR